MLSEIEWWANKAMWKIWQRFQRGLVRQMFPEFKWFRELFTLDESQCLLELVRTDLDGEGSVKHLLLKFWQSEDWNWEMGEVRSKVSANSITTVDYSYHVVRLPAFSKQGHCTGLSTALTKNPETLNTAVCFSLPGAKCHGGSGRLVFLFACGMVWKCLEGECLDLPGPPLS